MTGERRTCTRVLEITAALPGWRVVFLREPRGDEFDASDLLYTLPIACFALVESWEVGPYDSSTAPPLDSDGVHRDVRPMTACEDELEHDAEARLAIIGPNDDPDEWLPVAREVLKARRERRRKGAPAA